MAFRMATEHDREALMRMWQLCFGDSDSFCRWFFDERWNPELCAVYEAEGSPVAMVNGWLYTLNIRNHAVPAIMLCGVATLPEYRGRGLMRSCIELLLQAANRQGAVVIFHSPVNHRVYKSLRHYHSNDAAFVYKKPSASIRPGCFYPALPCSDELAAELLPIYTRCITPYSGAIIRTNADMALKLRDYASDGAQTIILRRGKEAAYAIYYTTDDGLQCLRCPEFCAESIALRDELIYALAGKSASGNIRLKLPPDISDSLPDGFSAEVRPFGIMGIVNMDRLLSLLCWPMGTSVKTELGLFGECLNKEQPNIELDSGSLIQLLVGYRSIEELVFSGQAIIRDKSSTEDISRQFYKLNCYVIDEY